MQEWLSLNLYEFSYKTDSCGAATLDLSGGGVFICFHIDLTSSSDRRLIRVINLVKSFKKETKLPQETCWRCTALLGIWRKSCGLSWWLLSVWLMCAVLHLGKDQNNNRHMLKNKDEWIPKPSFSKRELLRLNAAPRAPCYCLGIYRTVWGRKAEGAAYNPSHFQWCGFLHYYLFRL